MPSAWHRDDDRELHSPVQTYPCDCGCGGTVRIADEDWTDGMDYAATPACVLRLAARRHDADQYSEEVAS